MAQIFATPQAEQDVADAQRSLGLPADTWPRIARSLRLLEGFPLAGRALEGRWSGTRFVIGPWPWMILVYVYDEGADRVDVVAVHDARSATSPSLQ